MPENLENRTRLPVHIDMSDEWNPVYWMQELGVSHDELHEAVRAVGTEAALVRAYLNKPPKFPMNEQFSRGHCENRRA